MDLLNSTEQLVQMTCPWEGCGIRYAIPARVRDERKMDGESWNCPNGHAIVYRENDLKIAEQKVERLDRQLDRCSIARDTARGNAGRARNRAAGYLATITKWGRRLAIGNCPICGAVIGKAISTMLLDHIEVFHPNFIEKYRG